MPEFRLEKNHHLIILIRKITKHSAYAIQTYYYNTRTNTYILTLIVLKKKNNSYLQN